MGKGGKGGRYYIVTSGEKMVQTSAIGRMYELGRGKWGGGA